MPPFFVGRIDKLGYANLAVMTKMIVKLNFLKKYIDEIEISYYDEDTR